MTRFTLTTLVCFSLSLFALASKGDEKPTPKVADKTASDGWKKLFDGKSLDGWKASDFFKPGKTEVKDGSVTIETGKPMTGITYTRGDFPKLNYEVTLEAKKVAGDDFFCTTTFPVADSFCSLVVGGWGGQLVGLSSLDGADASENDTPKTKEFKHNQWYKVRVRVTKQRIQAWIDDEQLVDVDTTGRKISTRAECRVCQPFGIATYYTTSAVREIRVRNLTEKEKAASRAP